MWTRTLTAAAALVLLAGPAFAFGCPRDMRGIDAALAAGPTLSQGQLAEVRKYRAEGEALHKSGRHAKSIETLAKAKKILGIQ